MERIRRWQWVLIGLVAGLVLAEARRLAGTDWIDFGASFNDQELFERSLTERTNGKPHFAELTIYPLHVGSGSTGQLVHVVSGSFYDGAPERVGAEIRAVWRPRCFVAPFPYRPVSEIAGPAAANRSVADYLATVPGAQFRYAWWHDSNWARAVYSTGGVVLVGLVWPTIINLLVYGQLRRPAEARAARLPKPRARAVPASDPTAGGREAIEPLLAALESGLSPDAAAAAAEPRTAVPSPTPLRKLEAAPVDAAPAAPEKDQATFGEDAGDYYPTEVHARAKPREH